MTPQQVVEAALETGCLSISYTYTEPTIFYEYARDCARLGHCRRAQERVRHQRLHDGRDARATSTGDLHAANVDLKSFSDEFYRTLVGARLKPVLDSIRRLWDMGVWVEVTTLLIPGRNDSEGRAARAGRVPGVDLARHPLARVAVPPHLRPARRAADAGRAP